MIFQEKLQIVLISMNILGLIFICHCFAFWYRRFTWISKTKISESAAVTTIGFVELAACKTTHVLAPWWLQVNSIFIPEGVTSQMFEDLVKISFKFDFDFLLPKISQEKRY